MDDLIRQKIEAMPAQPGVYLFKDRAGVVIYVGKAKSLRSRVRSYFLTSGSDDRYFIPLLDEQLGDIDSIVTSNEKEALILENKLIKDHKPRFNVKLRDDKEFLSLRLDVSHPWPRLTMVRRSSVERRAGSKREAPAHDASRYFGPYHSATSARRTLHVINKHFQLRTCTDKEFANRTRPCLQYQIKRCPAPCVYDVDPKWYAEQVDSVAKFLVGRHNELSVELNARMRDASKEMKFELAVVYRDQLRAIENVKEGQHVVSNDAVDRDVIGLFREGGTVEIALLRVRGGKLADVMTFLVKQAEIPDEEIVAAFLWEHYVTLDKAGFLASEVLVPSMPEGAGGIEQWLSDRAGHRVHLLAPKRGDRAAIVAMANENAKHGFAEKRRASTDLHERLIKLQKTLRLEHFPHRIECCDISHLGGEGTVGSVVSMNDGAFEKKRYRTFHVRTVGTQAGDDATSPGGDDYAAMREVLARRFRRGANDEPKWSLPDLFVVDGGRGQLNVALAAARDLGLELSIVGLAKERETVGGEQLTDRVYLPGQKNPISLARHSQELFFLAQLRDEAHRFANHAREKLMKKLRFSKRSTSRRRALW